MEVIKCLQKQDPFVSLRKSVTSHKDSHFRSSLSPFFTSRVSALTECHEEVSAHHDSRLNYCFVLASQRHAADPARGSTMRLDNNPRQIDRRGETRARSTGFNFAFAANATREHVDVTLHVVSSVTKEDAGEGLTYTETGTYTL